MSSVQQCRAVKCFRASHAVDGRIVDVEEISSCVVAGRKVTPSRKVQTWGAHTNREGTNRELVVKQEQVSSST